MSHPNAPFILRDVALSPPRPDEVIVQLEASGVCHADLAARSGALPFPLPGVLGHEGVGRIVEVGSAVGVAAVGDRLVISFDWCSHCSACRHGAPAYCRHWPRLNLTGGSRNDGSATLSCRDGGLHGHFFGQSSFSRMVVTKARATVPVPEDVPAAVLAPLGCGVQTGVSAVTDVLRPAPSSRVAVFRAGTVGMSALMGLRATGVAKVIAVDVHPAHLALARKLGATDVVDVAAGNVSERIAALTSDAGIDGSIGTGGILGASRAAICSLASGGTCVAVGAPAPGDSGDCDVIDLVARGLRVVDANQGDVPPPARLSRASSNSTAAAAFPSMRSSRVFLVREINKVARASSDGTVIKPVLHTA